MEFRVQSFNPRTLMVKLMVNEGAPDVGVEALAAGHVPLVFGVRVQGLGLMV